MDGFDGNHLTVFSSVLNIFAKKNGGTSGGGSDLEFFIGGI